MLVKRVSKQVFNITKRAQNAVKIDMNDKIEDVKVNVYEDDLMGFNSFDRQMSCLNKKEQKVRNESIKNEEMRNRSQKLIEL